MDLRSSHVGVTANDEATAIMSRAGFPMIRSVALVFQFPGSSIKTNNREYV